MYKKYTRRYKANTTSKNKNRNRNTIKSKFKKNKNLKKGGKKL